jgi:hypothetical protein
MERNFKPSSNPGQAHGAWMQRIKEEKRGQKRFQAEGVSASLVTNNITSVPTANKYVIGRTSSANGHHIGTLTRKQVEKHFG